VWDNPELQRLKRAWLPECAQSKLIAQVCRSVFPTAYYRPHCSTVALQRTRELMCKAYSCRGALFIGATHARTLIESNRISCGQSLVRRVPYQYSTCQ
jgi:hypothetical protein